MKYLFILGRNPELSKAEVFAFMKRHKIEILDYKIRDNALLVDVKDLLPLGAIEKLGGVIAIGEVLSNGVNELDKKALYFGTENKLNYVIWDFGDAEIFRHYLKKRFKDEKLKATEKNLSAFMKAQDGEKIPVIGSKKIDEQYFAFDDYFGRIIQTCDYSEIERRDMKKPARRGMLAISPRLAKIMINLSEIGEKGKLLDPFCGIGVVLQEGLLQGLKVVGVDIEKSATDGAQSNLEWGKFSKEDYVLFNEDSRNVDVGIVDAIATEPDLGEVLKSVGKTIVRKTYSFERASKRMKGFETLMSKVLNNLKDKVSGKIVFTAPFIKCFDKRKRRVGCDIGQILDKTQLKLCKGFPIEDFREDQVTGRQIFVLKC
tara:strand:+ start:19 stop:1137 length:1119 start_codon:yes stop_codon:yes gene_type:complete